MKQTMENCSDETDRANRVWHFFRIQGKINYYIQSKTAEKISGRDHEGKAFRNFKRAGISGSKVHPGLGK